MSSGEPGGRVCNGLDPTEERTMTTQPASTTKLDETDLPDLPWAEVTERLETGITQAPDTGGPNRHTAWLATTGPDGAPDVRPVGAMWVDGAFYFTSGAGSRKAKNIAANPAASISIATQEFDVTIDGRVRRVTDLPTLEQLAAVYNPDWPAEVDPEARAFVAPFNAPSAGPPPWNLYVLEPTRAYANTIIEGYGWTRFDF
jgi:hypothetical protein